MENAPKYKCHKTVKALKIAKINQLAGLLGSVAHFEEPGNPPAELSHEFCVKHRPVVGGYIVKYEDGYLSFSPAKAFEEGYSLISDSSKEQKVVFSISENSDGSHDIKLAFEPAIAGENSEEFENMTDSQRSLQLGACHISSYVMNALKENHPVDNED